MCIDGGLSIIGLALSVAGSVASYGAKQQQYEKEVQYKRQSTINALAANRDQQTQVAKRQMQEQEAFQQKDHAMVLEGAEKEATALTTAAGANVTGISVQNLVGDIHRKVGMNRQALETNWKNTASQLQTENDAAVNKTQSQINSVPEPTAPSPVGMFLDIGQAGVKAFGSKG